METNTHICDCGRGYGETKSPSSCKSPRTRKGVIVLHCETCSKKVTASSVWAFADTSGGRGVDSASYAAGFLPLLLTTHGKANLAKFPGISFRVFVTVFDKNGRKKTGNLFLISCLLTAKKGGGYSVVIPRKQTCSLCLKRSLCRWGFCCPALSFSVGCKSR